MEPPSFHLELEEEHPFPSPPPPPPPSVKRELRGPANCYIHPIRLIAELRLLLWGEGGERGLWIIIIRVSYGRYKQIRFPPSYRRISISLRTSKFLLSSIAFITFIILEW